MLAALGRHLTTRRPECCTSGHAPWGAAEEASRQLSESIPGPALTSSACDVPVLSEMCQHPRWPAQGSGHHLASPTLGQMTCLALGLAHRTLPKGSSRGGVRQGWGCRAGRFGDSREGQKACACVQGCQMEDETPG